MTRPLFALSLYCVSLLNIVPAQASQMFPTKLPPPVAAKIEELQQDCHDFGGEPSDGSETIKTADLQENGITDYIFYAGDYNCDGAISAFSPTAATGAEADLYIGSKNGAVTLAWSGSVWDTRIETKNGSQILTASAAGIDCGETTPAKDIVSMPRCRLLIKYDKAKNAWEQVILK